MYHYQRCNYFLFYEYIFDYPSQFQPSLFIFIRLNPHHYSISIAFPSPTRVRAVNLLDTEEIMDLISEDMYTPETPRLYIEFLIDGFSKQNFQVAQLSRDWVPHIIDEIEAR